MYDTFVDKFTQAVKELKLGDPMDDATDIGPLAKASAVVDIDRQVQESISKGATLLTGGQRGDHLGPHYYLPTVLANVIPGMPVFDEEVFGPVAPITKANSIDEIITLANTSAYGLGCSIFGDDFEQKTLIASQIQASNIFFDKVVTSYAFLPYGGIKNT